jgi:hypothetical protein
MSAKASLPWISRSSSLTKLYRGYSFAPGKKLAIVISAEILINLSPFIKARAFYNVNVVVQKSPLPESRRFLWPVPY